MDVVDRGTNSQLPACGARGTMRIRIPSSLVHMIIVLVNNLRDDIHEGKLFTPTPVSATNETCRL